MWKGILDKGKCLLGFHDGPWRYRREGDCAQAMICTRCGVESERTEHRWAAWAYRAERACDRVRTCSRCQQSEERLEHVWGEPEYAEARVCRQVAICGRCRVREPRGVVHAFTRWEYRDADTCTQVSTCARCGEQAANTRVHHDWGAWTESRYYGTRVRACGHCGEMTLAVAGVSVEATPSMQAAATAIDRLLSEKNWEGVKARLTRDRSVLLSPVADQYCRFALDHYALDDGDRQALVGARRLVTLSREKGIDGALQELGMVPPPAPAPEPAAAPAAAPPPAASVTAAAQPLDTRLVGHWRTTEFLGGGGISMVTDTHCVLDRYGDFAWWSQTSGPMGPTDSDRDMGTWDAQRDRLVLRFKNGESLTREYLVEGDKMVWPRDGRYRYWEKVAW